ncbi:hypothetical protein DM785_02510 [Deinococcus actinosclerus]|nr:hypothetical protein DM785_02510 [Deinococcus actinosclerus]
MIFTTKKILTAALNALGKFAPRSRAALAAFHAFLQVTPTGNGYAVATFTAGGAAVRLDVETGAADVSGLWMLCPGWLAALPLVKGGAGDLAALELSAAGLLTVHGLEFARRPVLPGTAAEEEARLNAARAHHAETVAAFKAAGAAYDALGVEVFGVKGWKREGEKGARALTSAETSRRVELGRVRDEVHGAAAAAQRVLDLAQNTARDAYAIERHAAALRASLDLHAGDADGAVFNVPELRAVLDGAGGGNQRAFWYAWEDSGHLRTSDGYTIAEARPVLGALPVGRAWPAGELLPLVTLAGVRGRVELLAGGARAYLLGGSVAVSVRADLPGDCERPDFRRLLDQMRTAPVLASFSIPAGEAVRWVRLAGLTDHAALCAAGLYLLGEGVRGGDRWPGGCEVSWGHDGGAHALSAAALAQLKRGGSFTVRDLPGGVAVLVRETCGAVAIFNRDGDAVPAAATWARDVLGVGAWHAHLMAAPAATVAPAVERPRRTLARAARRFTGPAGSGTAWGALALRWAAAARCPDLIRSAYLLEQRRDGRTLYRAARRALRGVRGEARAALLALRGSVRAALALREAAGTLRAAAHAYEAGGAWADARRVRLIAAGWGRAADRIAAGPGVRVELAALLARETGTRPGRVLPGLNVGATFPGGPARLAPDVEHVTPAELAATVTRHDARAARADAWRLGWARPFLLTLAGLQARRAAVTPLFPTPTPAAVQVPAVEPAPLAAPAVLQAPAFPELGAPAARSLVFRPGDVRGSAALSDHVRAALAAGTLPGCDPDGVAWFTNTDAGGAPAWAHPGRRLSSAFKKRAGWRPGVDVQLCAGGRLVLVSATTSDGSGHDRTTGRAALIDPARLSAGMRAAGIAGAYAREARALLALLLERAAPVAAPVEVEPAPAPVAAPAVLQAPAVEPTPTPAPAAVNGAAPVAAYHLARVYLVTLAGVQARRAALVPFPTPAPEIEPGAVAVLGALEALALVPGADLVELGARVAAGDPVAVQAGAAAAVILAALRSPWRARGADVPGVLVVAGGPDIKPPPAPGGPGGAGLGAARGAAEVERAPTPAAAPDTAPGGPVGTLDTPPDTAPGGPADDVAPEGAPDTAPVVPVVTPDTAPGVPVVTVLGVTFSPADVPRDLATDAHRWTSFTPERRAEQEQQSYFSHVTAFAALVEANAGDRAQLAGELLAGYKAGYLQRLQVKLGRDSRTASTMITGGSKFPTARNRKRLDAAHNALTELLTWSERRRARILRVLREGPQQNAAQRADGTAAALAKREQEQEHMKAVNKACRSKDPHAALAALGITGALAEKYLKPDWSGQKGYPDYKLKNNGAEIRRLRAKLAQRVQVAQVAAVEAVSVADVCGVQVEEDRDADRLRLVFPGKPSERMRGVLKGRGFRWAPSVGAWQRQLTPAAREAARAVLDAFRDEPEAGGADAVPGYGVEVAVVGSRGLVSAVIEPGYTLTITADGVQYHGTYDERGAVFCPGAWVEVAGRRALELRGQIAEKARREGWAQ